MSKVDSIGGLLYCTVNFRKDELGQQEESMAGERPRPGLEKGFTS
jgi:hypothetical protein